MKKAIILTGALSMFLAVSCISYASGTKYEDREHAHHEAGHSITAEGELLPSGVLEEGVRIINVSALRYGFDPDPVVVRKGEVVRLVVTAIDVSHGLGILDYGINLKVQAHKTETVEFTADKIGDFHIHCTVYCGPGHAQMHGALKVID